MKTDLIKKKILVIEDDRALNHLLTTELQSLGYDARSARCWRDAKAYLGESEPDLILLDIRLPDGDGMEIVSALQGAPVIVLTAYGTIENAVRAMKLGAAEYLVKPVNIEELELAIVRALEHADLKNDMQFVRSRQRASRKSMVGDSMALNSVMALIDAVAAEKVTVLIQGESGAGKELVAREIHERSPRAERNYVAVDCCTIQESLFESELFGHEKGAFTGAVGLKKGLIEGAEGGTLFLDEIGEISAPIQAKLLRVLETGEFRRVGGAKSLIADVRIVAATNRDLRDLAQAGTFRADLYYRLSAFTITVPPLRERREDILPLAKHFLSHHDFSRRIIKHLAIDTLRALRAYDWPGNVRELRNVIERAIIVSGEDPVIRPRHLGLPSSPHSAGEAVRLDFDHEPTLEELKRSYIERLTQKYSGHRAQLAAILDISERNVYRLLKRYYIEKIM
jgi:DNA-binding NtrC family response regulator